MPCFNPILARVNYEKSKAAGIVKFDFFGRTGDKSNADIYAEMVRTKTIGHFTNAAGITTYDSLIPCRQCIGCRLEYSRQWANRLTLELGAHDPDLCWFVTFTYDEQPLNDLSLQTLVPHHMTDFLKRLRDHMSRDCPGHNLRYYYAGEYGETLYRPHYHAILYDLPISDLIFLKQTDSGPLFVSEWFDRIWSHGFCFIAKVSWEDCAYTARYVMKKLKGERACEYEAFKVVPEFARMSRRPGIGSQFFSIENFEKGILKYVNGRPLTVPKVWERYMKGCDLETLARVKDSKSLLTMINQRQFNSSDYLPSEKLKIREDSLADSIKKRENF